MVASSLADDPPAPRLPERGLAFALVSFETHATREGLNAPPHEAESSSIPEVAHPCHSRAVTHSKEDDSELTLGELESGVSPRVGLRARIPSAKRICTAWKQRRKRFGMARNPIRPKVDHWREYSKEVKRQITATRVQNVEIGDAGEAQDSHLC